MLKLYMHVVARHITGSYGVLMDNDMLPFAVALQPKDKCFEPGTYTCKKDFFHEGNYPTFEIEVQGHDRVLFHKGNHQEDSKLCVLVAESFDTVDGRPGIANAMHGFSEFWDKYKDVDEFEFIVTQKEGIQNATIAPSGS